MIGKRAEQIRAAMTIGLRLSYTVEGPVTFQVALNYCNNLRMAAMVISVMRCASTEWDLDAIRD